MDLGFAAYLKRNDLDPSTVKKHEINYRLLERECVPLSEKTFNEFLDRKMGVVSAAAINKYIQCAIWLCRYFDWEWSKSTFKKLREETKPRVTMSNEEILAFLDLPSRHKMYWKLLAFHGARPSEIAGLRVEDIDFANNSIIIGKSKTRTGRIVKINQAVVKELQEYIKTLKTQFLFTPRGKDRPISISSIDAEFKVKKELLGIKKPVTPHGFRHSFATRLLQEEQPLFVVMDILGHQSSKTTQIYFRSNLKAQEKAMKNDPLNVQSPEDKLNKIEEFIKNTLQGDTRFNQSLVRESIAQLWRTI
jgi:integrase